MGYYVSDAAVGAGSKSCHDIVSRSHGKTDHDFKEVFFKPSLRFTSVRPQSSNKKAALFCPFSR